MYIRRCSLLFTCGYCATVARPCISSCTEGDSMCAQLPTEIERDDNESNDAVVLASGVVQQMFVAVKYSFHIV